MAHEELKKLYEIDAQHSDTPWEFWELKNAGRWRVSGVPLWVVGIEYRRKPGAPAWPVSDDAEDARKWRELEAYLPTSTNSQAVVEKISQLRSPALTQSYTAEQWQAIIDGKFLCEFSDCEWEADSNFIVSTLTAINETSRATFSSPVGARYSYCRPLRIKGVRQPWFGGECPVAKDTKVLVKQRSGQKHEAITGSHLCWGHNRASYDILEFIEL